MTVTRDEVLNNIIDSKLPAYISVIDEQLLKVRTKSFTDKVVVALSGELDLELRNLIADEYVKNGGWCMVKHKTSSELKEKGSLTVFEFYFCTLEEIK